MGEIWSSKVRLSLTYSNTCNFIYLFIFGPRECWYFSSRNMDSLKSSLAAAKSLQSCPTLCDPIDGSPPGSPVTGILQARTLAWVAISFSSAWKWKVKSLSRVWSSVTPWTAAFQAPPSMGFSRQEYWSGVPLPSPQKLSYLWVVKLVVSRDSQTTACSNWSWLMSYYKIHS